MGEEVTDLISFAPDVPAAISAGRIEASLDNGDGAPNFRQTGVCPWYPNIKKITFGTCCQLGNIPLSGRPFFGRR